MRARSSRGAFGAAPARIPANSTPAAASEPAMVSTCVSEPGKASRTSTARLPSAAAAPPAWGRTPKPRVYRSPLKRRIRSFAFSNVCIAYLYPDSLIECGTMMRTALILIALLAPPLWADPFDDVLLKRQAMLTGGPGIDNSLPQIHAHLAGIESSARASWNGLNKDPGRTALWQSSPNATSSAQITSAWSRLKSMALAWATPGQDLYGDAALPADIRSAAAWLEENRYNARVPKEYDNWWDWEIGAPLQLGDLLVLLHGQLTPEETVKYAAAIDRFDSDPRVMIVNSVSTGANRVWKCMGAALRAIVVKDAAKLQLASDSQIGRAPCR